MENVYIAKLAVLIGNPKGSTTHCPRSLVAPGPGPRLGGSCAELEPHGVVRSERRTPFSLASCSRVMGMKEPGRIISLVS